MKGYDGYRFSRLEFNIVIVYVLRVDNGPPLCVKLLLNLTVVTK